MVLAEVRTDPPAADQAGRRHRRRPCRARANGAPRGPGGVIEIGTGVAIVGVVRRAGGVVSVAPNLGTARRLGRRAKLACAVSSSRTRRHRQRRRPRSPARLRRGAARGADHVVFVSGEVGVGGGSRGQPTDDGRGGTPARSGTCQSTGRARMSMWVPGLLGKLQIGERALLAAAGHDPDGGQVALEGGARWPRPRVGTAHWRDGPGGALARARTRAPGERAQPAADRPGRNARTHPPVRRAPRAQGASSITRCLPRANSCASSPPCSRERASRWRR